MFKYLGLIFCLCTIPLSVLASGKLILSPAYYMGSNKLRLSGGLGVYENLPLGLKFNGFAGSGESPMVDGSDLLWLVAKANVEFQAGKLIVGPGIGTSFFPDTSEVRTNVNVKVSYPLW